MGERVQKDVDEEGKNNRDNIYHIYVCVHTYVKYINIYMKRYIYISTHIHIHIYIYVNISRYRYLFYKHTYTEERYASPRTPDIFYQLKPGKKDIYPLVLRLFTPSYPGYFYQLKSGKKDIYPLVLRIFTPSYSGYSPPRTPDIFTN